MDPGGGKATNVAPSLTPGNLKVAAPAAGGVTVHIADAAGDEGGAFRNFPATGGQLNVTGLLRPGGEWNTVFYSIFPVIPAGM
jgi:hypothetical protein